MDNITFIDVPSSHWASEGIYSLERRGIVQGYPDNTFRPGGVVTIGEICSMAVHSANITSVINDNTTYGHWAEKYANYVKNDMGVCLYPEGETPVNGLDTPIKRQFAFNVAWHIAGSKSLYFDTKGATNYYDAMNGFDDRNDISPCAVEGVFGLFINNVATGYTDKTIRPNANITRAEVSHILSQCITSIEIDLEDGSRVMGKTRGEHVCLMDGSRVPSGAVIYTNSGTYMMMGHGEEKVSGITTPTVVPFYAKESEYEGIETIPDGFILMDSSLNKIVKDDQVINGMDEILGYLKELTDDELDLDSPQGIVTIKALSNNPKKKNGTALIRAVMDTPYTTTIQYVAGIASAVPFEPSDGFYGDSLNGYKGIGANARISIDPYLDLPEINATYSVNGDDFPSKTPVYINLGHELIHSYYLMKGECKRYDFNVGPRELANRNPYINFHGEAVYGNALAEELYTVGLPEYNTRYFTENKLREEQEPKLPFRVDYED